MSAGLQVIGVYLDRFATFIKEVAKPSSKIDEALIASNLVLGQNVRALQDHLISKNVDLDPSDRQVIEDALRLCDLLRSPGYTIPSRRLQQKMDMSHEAVEGLGVKYKVPMDWSPYTRPQSSGTSTSSFSKPSVTQVSDATSSLKPDQKSDDNSGFMVADVRVCIWDRCLGGPEAITFLDKPSFELDKSYSGRTSINKILMDLENDGRFSFRRTFRCYSPRDQEHNFTRPALRWSPREETRRIASLPKFGDITTIHVILDTSFFLLFILYVQPFQPAQGIVVGMKNEQDSYNVEQYLLRGLCLTKGDLYYQEIEGDHRLQLTGCRLEPFSCDWCILRGRPKMDN